MGVRLWPFSVVGFVRSGVLLLALHLSGRRVGYFVPIELAGGSRDPPGFRLDYLRLLESSVSRSRKRL